MRSKQSDFFSKTSEYAANRLHHGGVTAGRRKVVRPLDRRRPLHLVLKSSAAKGVLSFLSARNKLFVEQAIRENAKKFGVTIQGFQNVGNHLHIIARFSRREGFQNFLRTVTALIARFVTGARRGKPFGRRFWDALAFTRVIVGRRDLAQTETYLQKNEIERENGKSIRTLYEKAEDYVKKQRREVDREVAKYLRENGGQRRSL